MTTNGRDVTTRDRPITRADLEAKFEQLQGSVSSSTEAATSVTPAALIAGAAVVVLVAVYLLGRRRGKRRSAIVEIRRV
jgi:hypothetical protein